MASAVVSGAAALLLDERANLRPRDMNKILRLTSSSSSALGILDAGSGSVNALGAAQFVENHFKGLLPTTEIAGEQSVPSGILSNYSANGQQQLSFGNSIVWSRSLLRGNSIVWSGSDLRPDSIVWSGYAPEAQSIVWSGSNSIVWSGSTMHADSVWQPGPASTSIVWSGSIVDLE